MCAAIPATSTPGPKAVRPAGATPRCCPTSARARGWRRPARSSSTRRRTTPMARWASRSAPRCSRPRSDFVEAAVAAGIPRGDYNGRDRGGAGGRCVADPIHDTATANGRAPIMPSWKASRSDGPTSRSSPARRRRGCCSKARPDRLTATGVEYRTAAGEIGDGPCEQRSDPERRCDRLAAPAAAVRHWAAARTGSRRRPLPAWTHPHVGKHLKDHLMVPLFFPAPGRRRVDERGRAVDGTGGVARPGRTAAGRPR